MDKSFDYFELRYGKAFEPGGWNEWIPIAIVGRMRKGLVNVQFLIDMADPPSAKIVDDAVKELNFYLAELNEADPWRYLQYHCGTESNVYSAVHWSFISGSTNPAEPQNIKSSDSQRKNLDASQSWLL